MEEVIHYLDLKNQYYEKFYTVTCRFLEQLNSNRWDDVSVFVDNRERILNIIRSFDFKIAQIFEAENLSDEDMDVYRDRVKALLDKRKAIADRIVAIDLELIGKMDEVKSDTIRDLKGRVESTPTVPSPEAAAEKKPAKLRRDI